MSPITPTILFFYGEDTYRSGQKLAALKARYIDASLGDTNLAVLEGATILFEDFVRQVQALPFLAKRRLVIVKNIFGGGKKDLLDAVASYLPKVPETTVLVFYEAGVPDKRLKLFTLLNQAKSAEVFSPLVGAELTAWITHRALEVNLELTPRLVSWLVTAVGSDLARLDQELIKLNSYQLAKKEPISEDDLAALVWQTVPSDAFRLVDALSNRRGAQAVTELTALLTAGQAELQIFGLIVFQYRSLLLI
ncbi:MAG: DNA polymerase III subunit delta, partial [Patescibacteria group bacterium]